MDKMVLSPRLQADVAVFDAEMAQSGEIHRAMNAVRAANPHADPLWVSWYALEQRPFEEWSETDEGKQALKDAEAP